MFIQDLLDGHRMLTYGSFKNRYRDADIDFVTYYGLIDAIPQEWKDKLRNHNTITHLVENDLTLRLLTTRGSVSKLIYQQVSNRSIEFPEGIVGKWNCILESELIQADWNKIFRGIYKVTISTNLRAFQFKLLHRILATKRRLFIWKINESEACTFCQQQPETDVHLFWECSVVKLFWEKIWKWFYNMTGITVHLNKLNVILGLDMEHLLTLNIVIVVGKHYLFQCSFNNSRPYLTSYIEYLKVVKDTEYIIACKNSKLLIHEKKWQDLQHI